MYEIHAATEPRDQPEYTQPGIDRMPPVLRDAGTVDVWVSQQAAAVPGHEAAQTWDDGIGAELAAGSAVVAEVPQGNHSEQSDESQAEIVEPEEPLAQAGGGSGGGEEPPIDDHGPGADFPFEGDDHEWSDLASQPVSVENARAVWDMGKVLLDAKGETSPFRVEADDGTVHYDDDFPGSRRFIFPPDTVVNAGFEPGTNVVLADIPAQVYNEFTRQNEQYDPSVHQDGWDETMSPQVSIGIYREADGLHFTRDLSLGVQTDGSLEPYAVYRSGPEAQLADKPEGHLTEEDLPRVIEYMDAIGEESAHNPFSQLDARRMLRLIASALLEENR